MAQTLPKPCYVAIERERETKKPSHTLNAVFTKKFVHRVAFFLTACQAIALSQSAAQHGRAHFHECDQGLIAELSGLEDYDSSDAEKLQLSSF